METLRLVLANDARDPILLRHPGRPRRDGSREVASAPTAIVSHSRRENCRIHPSTPNDIALRSAETGSDLRLLWPWCEANGLICVICGPAGLRVRSPARLCPPRRREAGAREHDAGDRQRHVVRIGRARDRRAAVRPTAFPSSSTIRRSIARPIARARFAASPRRSSRGSTRVFISRSTARIRFADRESACRGSMTCWRNIRMRA